MNKDDSVEKKKDDLLRVMSDVNSQASEIEVRAREIARAARLTQDLTAPLHDLIERTPIDLLALKAPEWDRQIEVMRQWQGVAIKLQSHVVGTLTSSFGAVTAAVANTCGTSLFVASSASQTLGFKVEAVELAQRRLSEVLGRSDLLERVRSSMLRLGLQSQGHGFRSPMDLLDEAHAHLQNPALGDGRPTSVLIPLRECINACLAVLLKRRPAQESAPKKIVALGSQCSQAGLTPEFFAGLQYDYDALWKRLSSAKDAELSREQVNALFNLGLTFLDALMSSLDEGRLKPVK
jgi:hypothetical protein